METNELTVEAQDEQEWQLADEELNRPRLTRLSCSGASVPPLSAPR
jgi:hypothetical protein